MNHVTIGENKHQQHIDYLNMIQSNICRMSGNSAIMKGFAATVIAAMFGMTVAECVEWYHLLIAFVPIFAFIRLDIYYLQLEKKYRNLYALVAVNAFNPYFYALDLKAEVFKDKQVELNKDAGFWKMLLSVSIGQFYIWFISVAVVLIILAI